MPRLEPLPYFTEAINESTWRAMLQSGAIGLLDASFILQVDNFFATNKLLRQETTHFNRMQNQYLLPYVDADITKFYDTATKKIKLLYRWYLNFLKSNPTYLRTMNRQAGSIIAKLENKMSSEQLKKAKDDSI